ncbi:uncharacterized protein [Lepeophtheirus salmonis]|uniref:uncharacterized protein n=1 Tax=Lepeophtheirus salmonis TaxID=72036 RepID=UPI001AE7815F|nr:uncharacterized protein LOC121132221 [Lepeophtheirus salmonis]
MSYTHRLLFKSTIIFIIGTVCADLSSYGINDQFAAESNNLNIIAAATNSLEPLDPIAALGEALPGIPGEDYPILFEVPETAFGCEGRVEGGLYADSETECQAFHICVASAESALAKYSFLCPNGTIFNQDYFVCDWWFNFDCANAEGLYFRNEEVAAEREASSNNGNTGNDLNGSASGTYQQPSVAPGSYAPQSSYSSSS